MVSEFKSFLLKTNALALAVGVIIGVALGAVVNSLVNDIIMPPIGMLLGKVDFSQLKIVLQQGTGAVGDVNYVAEVAIRWGNFINVVIAFVVIAFVVFQIGKNFMKEPPPAEVKTCPFCKESNAPDASKCKACTSAI
ncbi:MAG: large conductance mechanosensitive channel protein MscL [Chloroflexi bacterium]|nr:large conductance mechanosensitive channel protein MscL [Chloroflexota bacterium]